MDQKLIDEKKEPKVSRSWCCTDYHTLPGNVLWANSSCLRYGVYQPEICPETKNKHLQIYLEFSKAVSIGEIRKIFSHSVRCFSRKGTREQARNYCMDRKKPGGTWGEVEEYGSFESGGQGKRSDLDGAVSMVVGGKSITELATTHPRTYVIFGRGLERLKFRIDRGPKWRDMRVEITWGAAGKGKTKPFVDKCEAEKLEYFELDIFSKRLWFDGYDDEPVLLINDPDMEYFTQAYFKKITDGYRWKCETKGGYTWAKWTRVYITSEQDPQYWWSRMDEGVRRRIHSITHVS